MSTTDIARLQNSDYDEKKRKLAQQIQRAVPSGGGAVRTTARDKKVKVGIPTKLSVRSA